MRSSDYAQVERYEDLFRLIFLMDIQATWVPVQGGRGVFEVTLTRSDHQQCTLNNVVYRPVPGVPVPGVFALLLCSLQEVGVLERYPTLEQWELYHWDYNTDDPALSIACEYAYQDRVQWKACLQDFLGTAYPRLLAQATSHSR